MRTGLITLFFALLAWAQPPAIAQGLTDSLAELFPDDVLVKALDFKITRRELETSLIRLKANNAARGVAIPRSNEKLFEAQLLDKLITTKVLLHRANAEDRKRGIAAATKLLSQLRAKLGSAEAYQREFLTAGMTEEFFTLELQQQAIAQAVIVREVQGNYQPTPEEMKRFYERNKEAFRIPERARVRHIFLSAVNPISGRPFAPKVLEQKKQQLAKIRARLVKGEDFGALAAEFSQDGGTKDRGGEFVVYRGGSDGLLEAAVFSLKLKQISKVVPGRFGFHLVQLLERVPADYSSFEAVKKLIGDKLRTHYIAQRLPAYLEKAKKEAAVKIVGDIKPISALASAQPLQLTPP